MKYFFFLLSVVVALNCRGQQHMEFYDYKWQPTTVENALYFSTLDKEDNGFHRKDYFVRNQKLQMDGHYADSSCKIKNGDFTYFYFSGNLEAKGKYDHNKAEGQYLRFYEDGMMKDSFFYLDNHMVGNSYSWHQNGMMKDSISLDPDGSGIEISWHDNGNPSAAGYFSKGHKHTGTWTFYHANGKMSAKEQYRNDTLIDKKYFDEQGTEETDTTNTDREVSFPGGTKAWSKYVSRHSSFPDGWKITNTNAVVVIVTGTVNEDGNVTNTFVEAPFHADFDKMALNILRSSPKWIPAISHHRKVKTVIRQPVTFAQED